MYRCFGTLCSIFIGHVNKKNSWDKTTRVFIQLRVLAQKKPGPIRRRRDGEWACPIRGTSCGWGGL